MTRDNDRGAVLVIVLLIVLVLLGLGMTGLFLTSGTIKVVTNINLSSDARVVAEAGLERARFLLQNKAFGTPIESLLAGSGHSGDEIPANKSECENKRGAILLDTTTSPSTPLFQVSYPTIDRSELPSSAGDVPLSMGFYTVYIRQDQSDCRMGNFSCERTVQVGDGGPIANDAGVTPCSPPSGTTEPNGYVTVHSEGVARDGRTKEVVEATYYIRESSNTGTGGAGTGGSTGTGGSSGTGGNGTGGGGGTGGAGGVGGTGGAGGGTGGSTSSLGPCLNYAVSAIAPCPGGWSPTPGCVTIGNFSKVDSLPSGPANISMTCSQAAASSKCPNNCPVGCITGTIDYSKSLSLGTGTMPNPSYTPNSTILTVSSAASSTTVTPPNQDVPVYFQEVNVSVGTLTLKAGKYVVTRLNLNSGTLSIDDSAGPVALWVLDFLSPSSTVTVASGKASRFWMVYNGTQQVNNNTNNNFTGVLFAPAAEINLNYVINGAVVGGKVTLNSPSKVHFDTGLKCP